jgi:hypothetical protein
VLRATTSYRAIGRKQLKNTQSQYSNPSKPVARMADETLLLSGRIFRPNSSHSGPEHPALISLRKKTSEVPGFRIDCSFWEHSMSGLDGASFLFACPQCQFLNSATVLQARLGRRIICRGCKINLCLTDRRPSLKNAARKIDREIESLSETMKLEIKL